MGSTQVDTQERVTTLLEKALGVVFRATPDEPFFNANRPLMDVQSFGDNGITTLEEYCDDFNVEVDEAKCDNCEVAFKDARNWFFYDGNEIFGAFCWKCVAKTLNGREVFASKILPEEFIEWRHLDPRPSIVCHLDDWYSLEWVTGKFDASEISCWSCGGSNGQVSARFPHWEIEIVNSKFAVCDQCINAAMLLVPNPELGKL